MKQYIAFLRGINVGGHHKVPMAELKELLPQWGFKKVLTLLNSGNIIFETELSEKDEMEDLLSSELENHFGFQIPCLIRSSSSILKLIQEEPFKGIEMNKNVRLYISFLRKEVKPISLNIPYTSDDGSFRILDEKSGCICSVLDLTIGKTPKAMELLERNYQKENITTRNWNTLLKIKQLLTK